MNGAERSGISIEAVVKSYHRCRKRALDGLDAVFPEGAVTGLIGPNGCGKSTLAKLVSGAARPDSGCVLVAGRRADQGAWADRLQVSVMHQKPTFEMMLTPLDNLQIGAWQRGTRWSAVRSRVLSLLDSLGFDRDLLTKMTWTLSGGEMKRLQFARCLISLPRYFLLEEPTAGLDLEGRIGVWNLLHEMSRQSGMGLVWTTHNVEEIEDNCTRLLLMGAGRSVYEGGVRAFIAAHDWPTLVLRFQGPPGASDVAAAGEIFGEPGATRGNCLASFTAWRGDPPSIDQHRNRFSALEEIYVERPCLERAYSRFLEGSRHA